MVLKSPTPAACSSATSRCALITRSRRRANGNIHGRFDNMNATPVSISIYRRPWSVFQKLSSDPKMRKETMDIRRFLDGIHNCISMEDVVCGVPDPPDFLVKAKGKTIGLELTT